MHRIIHAWLLVLAVLNLTFLGYAHLVSNTDTASGPAEPGVSVPRLALVSELKAPAGPHCLSVGPFADRTIASQAAVWLRGAHHLARERNTEVEGAVSYWVEITTKTLQEAARLSMRLKAAGVTDRKSVV